MQRVCAEMGLEGQISQENHACWGELAKAALPGGSEEPAVSPPSLPGPGSERCLLLLPVLEATIVCN